MTGGMSSRTCHIKLNFDFPYLRSLLLRLDTYYIFSNIDKCCISKLTSTLLFFRYNVAKFVHATTFYNKEIQNTNALQITNMLQHVQQSNAIIEW